MTTQRLFRFLGGIYVALFLIFVALIFIIVGTFVESKTDSHHFAERVCYHNPLFKVILWGCFFNILFAALNRFPFQKKHIPFLLAHLGLLMILGGTLVKSYFGLQATVALLEGERSSSVIIPGSYALNLETRRGFKWERTSIPLKQGQVGKIHGPIAMTILDWTPHVQESFEGWIKDDTCFIWGYPPFKLSPFEKNAKPQIGARVAIPKNSYTYWDLYAFKSEEIESIISSCYQQSIQEREMPTLICIRAREYEHLIAFYPGQEPFAATFSLDAPQEYLLLDKGYQGYGLSLCLPPSFSEKQIPIELTTHLTAQAHTTPIPLKREDATPRIRLLTEKNTLISLTYDQFGTRFFWPIIPGKWKGFFGAKKVNIPYAIRLQRARKIDYPGSTQAFSYECDLLIDEKPVTLAMNKVFQTKKGYRFYLANLFIPEEECRAKKVQLIVNYDPARYLLTYPGGGILALGMILLFWLKPYRKK